jgi:rubrerythrin
MAKNLDPLKFAHEFEVKGLNFYLKYAFKTKNTLAKELFYNLAQREIEHAQKLDVLFNQAEKSTSGKIDLSADASGIERELKSFFKTKAAKELKSGPLDIIGYKLAMKMENKSIEIYTKMRDKAQTPAKRKFFDLLVAEEESHFLALDNVFRYLTNTGDWMQEEESKTWNWMNL